MLARSCLGCGRPFADTDPLPEDACVHFVDDELALSCGAACRQKLGLRTHWTTDRCPEPCVLCGTPGVAP